MSLPILYAANEKSFDHNGFGILADCVSCAVTEKTTGEFELTMEYPESGKRADLFELDQIIKAKPNRAANPQLFRIYSISKPMSNNITISAQHISYDLSGIPVAPFSASSPTDAFSHITNGMLVPSQFTFETDLSTFGELIIEKPSSVRSVIMGTSNSVVNSFGGELEFDNFSIKLHKNRGSDKGFSIRYGKNLKSLTQDENCADVITGICPYYVDSDNGSVFMLSDPVVYASNEFDHNKIVPVDFSKEFEKKPTEDELFNAAIDYMAYNNIGVPKVSLNISYVQKDIDDLALYDTVSVVFPKMKINTKAVVNTIVYNVLLDRNESISIGTIMPNIADTILMQRKDIAQKTDIGAPASRVQSSGLNSVLTIFDAGFHILGTKQLVKTMTFGVSAGRDGWPVINIAGEERQVEWADNGDGTYSMVGKLVGGEG